MPNPIVFPSSTPGLGLPLLIAGQAQKEFFLNQALCVLDALHSHTVMASQSVPPDTAQEGDCFRVTDPAQAAWASHENALALLVGGTWHFIAPCEGMQVFDTSAGHTLIFRGVWESAAVPVNPSGGTIIDAEARSAIAALSMSLQAMGWLAPSAP
ncbi:MAG: DUF2793 domain-containing protein [Sphingomonadales bacterium]|nr:DUF2793 domain-containing protein [Sphingomonadales bacterium]NCQ21244.1 DUF2793 domain-containing protein [Sphingomonadales bacterium]NCT04017.1 DUF2793 domain-containing protein [Sphingomonadales bacterium]